MNRLPSLFVVCALAACSGDDPSSTTPTEPTGTTPPPTTPPTETTDTGTIPPEPLQVISEPTLADAVDPAVYGVKRLLVEVGEPTHAVIEIDDGEQVRRIEFDAVSAVHDLPLLGLLPDTDHVVTLELTADRGVSETFTVPFHSDPLTLLLPDLTLRISEPTAEGGWTVVPAFSTDLASRVLILDAQARPVWVWEPPDEPKAVSIDEGGVMSALVGARVSRRTLTGELLALYSETDLGPGTVLVEQAFHHEAVFDPDGALWSLTKDSLGVPDYPTSELDPSITAPARVAVDRVVKVAPDGSTAGSWAMAERLDPTRIGFGSLDEISSGFDWSHGNAVVPLPGEDAFLVSSRHQDAIVKVRESTGEVIWILANPDGWPPELDALRLQPIGADFQWPYHQHAPAVDGDLIWMFDNGNERRTTPYSLDPHPYGSYTRVVGYRIDEVARTVSQEYQLDQLPDGVLFAQALGNADPLPLTGHVFSTWAYLRKEDGVSHLDSGKGTTSNRLIEWDPVSDAVVWDVSLYGMADEAPAGWLVDRATRVESLYRGLGTETVVAR